MADSAVCDASGAPAEGSLIASVASVRRLTPQQRTPLAVTRAFQLRKDAATTATGVMKAGASLFPRGMIFAPATPLPGAAQPHPDDYVRTDEEGCTWLPQSFFPLLFPYGVPCAYCDAFGATFQRWASCSPRFMHGLPGLHTYFCDYKCQGCGQVFNGLNMDFIAKLPPAVRHAFPALLSADTGMTWKALDWLIH